uniref:Uncharacterized protein n=1 Tax=viral metagenome TaxID=1070528 RepID=A0A6C0ACH6_9ZZZZ
MSTPLSISSLSEYDNERNKLNNVNKNTKEQLSIEDSIFEELTEINTSETDNLKQENNSIKESKLIELKGGGEKENKKKHKKKKKKVFVKLPKKVYNVDELFYSPPLEYSDM